MSCNNLCTEGVGMVEDVLGNVGCDAAGDGFETACQLIAVPNMIDGIGEALEFVCVGGGIAIGDICSVGSDASNWKPLLQNNLCCGAAASDALMDDASPVCHVDRTAYKKCLKNVGYNVGYNPDKKTEFLQMVKECGVNSPPTCL